MTDVFLNPRPEEAEAVERERSAGLEELELFARGLISDGRVQPEAQIHSEPGAVREGAPLSQKGDGK